MSLFSRAIRPPEQPNDNDPATEGAPGTVGPPEAQAGDSSPAITVEGPSTPNTPLPTIVPSAWAGWPGDWDTPQWHGHAAGLTDIAWKCLDLNASVLATMPPYLVGAAQSLDDDWITNPDPSIYTSWEEFARQMFWDFQGLGEVFVWAVTRYSTGWPARLRVLPPWMVNVEMSRGERRYTIGGQDETDNILHIRYASTIADAHGHGPLEAGRAKLVAANLFSRYGASIVANGGIPTSILEHPDRLDPQQILDLKSEWVKARISSIGEPAVLSGGVTWRTTQINPKDMALAELSALTDARIAVMLGVPPFLVGLPSGGDSLTYSNVTSLFDYHWRAGLRPLAQTVMAALSGWLVPRGTRVEVNRDAYVQPEPKERAETAKTFNSIVDAEGRPALSVDEIRAAERFDDTNPNVAQGVLRG